MGAVTGTSWLTDDEQRVWRAYLRTQARLTAALHRQLQTNSGLSLADYEVLVHLTDAEHGRLRPYELQQALEWEQSRLSHHLSRMQRRALIRREGCDGDGRGAYVTVTDTGRNAIDTAAPGHVDAVRRMFFDHLDAERLAVLDEITRRILDSLDATPGSTTTCG